MKRAVRKCLSHGNGFRSLSRRQIAPQVVWVGVHESAEVRRNEDEEARKSRFADFDVKLREFKVQRKGSPESTAVVAKPIDYREAA
jgi:hypothetical protein